MNKEHPHDSMFVAARQCVVLGMLLADKKLRAKVEPCDFSDWLMQGGVRDLKADNPKYAMFSELMQEWFGLKWDGKQKPIDMLIEAIKRDGQSSILCELLNGAIKRTLPYDKEDFGRQVLGIADTLKQRQDEINARTLKSVVERMAKEKADIKAAQDEAHAITNGRKP